MAASLKHGQVTANRVQSHAATQQQVSEPCEVYGYGCPLAGWFLEGILPGVHSRHLELARKKVSE